MVVCLPFVKLFLMFTVTTGISNKDSKVLNQAYPEYLASLAISESIPNFSSSELNAFFAWDKHFYECTVSSWISKQTTAVCKSTATVLL